MTEAEQLIEIEKIWKKHATGRSNLIATFLPHANQIAFFKEIIRFYSTPYINDPPSKEKLAEVVRGITNENK